MLSADLTVRAATLADIAAAVALFNIPDHDGNNFHDFGIILQRNVWFS